jgi:hypothetical protein
MMPLIAFAMALTTSRCVTTDGDTLRCGAERVRILGIDSPEMPGHCRRGRHCVSGDGRAAKRSLAAAVADRPIYLVRYGQDRYGRTLARVWAGGIDLACHQIAHGQAVYVARWDRRGVVARECGLPDQWRSSGGVKGSGSGATGTPSSTSARASAALTVPWTGRLSASP